jgi:hypothetical protein
MFIEKFIIDHNTVSRIKIKNIFIYKSNNELGTGDCGDLANCLKALVKLN